MNAKSGFLVAAGIALVAGCGGATASDDTSLSEPDSGEPSGTGGASSGTGGASSGTGGASSGNGGSAGSIMPGSGGAACCLAAAACDPGDMQIPASAPCPAGARCYDRSACCSTIRCAGQLGNCDALPLCDPGDLQIAACPPSATCYERALCGLQITCLKPTADAGPGCNPSVEYYRHYVGFGDCAAIDYDCPDATSPFQNECGCGCQQSPSCPPSVNCLSAADIAPPPGAGIPAPIPQPPDLCQYQVPDPCPYTIRAR